MAEQIISPGVFTRENDLSFLPQGVGAIGAAIVGPTVKGPAFVPTVIRNFSEYERRFGGLSSETYVPQTVREYLRNAGSVTVCRVLAGGGVFYENGTNEVLAIAAGSEGDTGATFASASLVLVASGDEAEPGMGLPSGSAHQLTINGIDFIGVDSASLFNDSSTEIYYNLTNGIDNMGASLAAAIVASSSLMGVTALYTASSNTLTLYGTTAGNKDHVIISSASQAGNSQIPFDFTDPGNTGAAITMSAGIDGTDGHKVLLGAIFPSKALTKPDLGFSTINDTHATGVTIDSNFNLKLSGSVGGTNVTQENGTPISASINPANSNYLFKRLGFNANNSKTGANEYAGTPGYTYINFKDLQTGLQGTGSLYTGYSSLGSSSLLYLVTQSSALNYTDGGTGKAPTEGYGWASTPYITSQFVDNDKTTKELFRFHTIDHGTHLCHEYKISIANLKEPSDIDNVEQYSNFSVLLRKAGDRDKSPNILEQYNNVNLNPNSPRYIARVIGDRYPQYNDTLDKVELLGDYPNISNYIRVEVKDEVAQGSLSPKLSPKGFKAVKDTIKTSSFAVDMKFPSASYEGTQVIGSNYASNGFLGFKFTEKAKDNEAFLQPLPDNNTANVSGDFNVENYSGHASSALWTGSLSASIDSTGATGPTANQLKFTVPFQGGDDGIAPYIVKQIGANISMLRVSDRT